MPARTPEALESALPSGTALEASVLRYLASCLGRRHGLAEGAVALASPAQPGKSTLGFDEMAALPDGRYAVLQFQRPRFHADTAYFELPLPRFCVMLRYPPRSAFYMLPIARTGKGTRDDWACLPDSTLVIDAQDLLALFNHAWLAQRAFRSTGNLGGSA